MKRKSNSRIRAVLQQIIYHPQQYQATSSNSVTFLEDKARRLQLENRILSEQLSQQIEGRECLGALLREQRQKNTRMAEKIVQMEKIQEEISKKKESKENSGRKIDKIKYGGINGVMNTLSIQVQNKELKEKIEDIMNQIKDKQQGRKKLKQEVLFAREHLKRAQQEKADIQEEMELAVAQIVEMRQLMLRQNEEISRLKLEVERATLSIAVQPVFTQTTHSLQPSKWNTFKQFKQQLRNIFSQEGIDKKLPESIQIAISKTVNEFEEVYLQDLSRGF